MEKRYLKNSKTISKNFIEFKRKFLKKFTFKIKKYKSFAKSKRLTAHNYNFKINGINSNNFIFYVYLSAGLAIGFLVFIFVTKKVFYLVVFKETLS